MSDQSSPFRGMFLSALAGSSAARGELLEMCRVMITRGGYRPLDPSVTALSDDDLWQEVFVRIVSRWNSVRGKSLGEFYHWVRKILDSTRRRLEDAFVPAGKRDPSRELRRDDEANAFLSELMVSEALSPEQAAEAVEHERLVQRAVRKLGADERGIVQMWMDGLSLEVIAGHLGESHGIVRRKWRAARDRLAAPLRVCV